MRNQLEKYKLKVKFIYKHSDSRILIQTYLSLIMFSKH